MDQQQQYLHAMQQLVLLLAVPLNEQLKQHAAVENQPCGNHQG
jgi:hypothetical protein